MNDRMPDARWERLVALLEPVHEQALATARRLCRSSFDGDDLYQEALLRAYEKLHTLRDESRFRSWFYATLLSRHRTRVRRPFGRRMLRWEDVYPDGGGPHAEDGSLWSEEAWRAKRVAQALANLPAVQREAVVLFEVDDFSIEEIAAMQRVSISAVKSRLARGRDRLRRYYEECEWVGDPVPESSGSPPTAERSLPREVASGGSATLATVPVTGATEKEKRHG